MCGISGIYRSNRHSVRPEDIRRMLMQIQYRGPDESGIYIGEGVGLGNVRLSIIDLKQGQQPMSTPGGDLWIVYNGEIFNYPELKQELKDLGYRFRTGSDTEVLLMLFSHYREKCLEKLNGQFAFAIWDRDRRELFLARDRIGIRPLFYARDQETLVFGSEIKSILESGEIRAELDMTALNRAFTFWTIPSPGTMFKGIFEVPPGHYMIAGEHRNEIKPYWELDFSPRENGPGTLESAIEEFESLITDAVRLRLRSDVQVAAYLSGGIDSSATTWLIKKVEPGVLNTFSIGFDQPEFDETAYQQSVSTWLDTTHRSVSCRTPDIAEHFARVIWHTEIPVLRTAAVPMFLLSGLVHDNGIKVVITGEGADEFLGGYNIFKEALVREFWSRQPDSKIRPLLLEKLYPYLGQFSGRASTMHRLFFGYRLRDTDSPVYSHLVRWNNSRHIREHFRDDVNGLPAADPVDELVSSLPASFSRWDLLSRAQWIESKLFLSGYLLSSQGDRVAMAHSVEGRYPFLDHRVMAFCAGLSPRFKIRGLNEKYLLKQMMKGRLPDQVVFRPKQAYRAPVGASLLAPEAPGYIREMLSASAIRKHGVFKPETVERLVNRASGSKTITENENMALAGILSTQILLDVFVAGNNPFRKTAMQTDCPVVDEKSVQTK